MSYSNFHTHSVFCDGKHTMEDTVRAAIALGCPQIGFSGHCFTSFDPEYCMGLADLPRYRKEGMRLKEHYADQIRVFTGIEQDIDSTESTEGFDYVIGSVHYLRVGDRYLSVDSSPKDTLRLIESFDGDAYAFCEAYYARMEKLYETTKCQIIAHFDLPTKFNARFPWIDTFHPRYRRAVESALDALCPTPAVFEINTGAMARGYRTSPYPQDWILQEIARRCPNKPVLLSSDCHDATQLLYQFDAIADRVKGLGLTLCRGAEDFL